MELVDFNDQKRGRLTLIRDLLDNVPDTYVPEAEIELPPLNKPPSEESYKVLNPLPKFRG